MTHSRALGAGGVPSPPDADLVAAARSGNERAFGVLVDRYENLVSSIAFALLGDSAVSEEVAQEIFLTAWIGLPSLRGEFKAWLRGIARHVSLRARRTAGRRLRPRPLPARAEVPSAAPSALQSIIEREEEELAWRALARIPETYRIPIVLYYREQRSMEEVARALNLSDDTVRQRLLRGRRMLKEDIEPTVASSINRIRKRSLAAAVCAAITAGDFARAKAADKPSRLYRRTLALPAAAAIVTLGWVMVASLRAPDGPVTPQRPRGGAESRLDPAMSGRPRRSGATTTTLPSSWEMPVVKAGLVPQLSPEKIIFQADFESGASPWLFERESEATTACPGRTGNVYCMEGRRWPTGPYLQVGLRDSSRPMLFRYSPSQVLAFDHWVASRRRMLNVQIGCKGRGTFYVRLRDLPPHEWGHAEVPLAQATLDGKADGPPLVEGDAIGTIFLNFRNDDDPTAALYIDNVLIFEP